MLAEARVHLAQILMPEVASQKFLKAEEQPKPPAPMEKALALKKALIKNLIKLSADLAFEKKSVVELAAQKRQRAFLIFNFLKSVKCLRKPLTPRSSLAANL